MSVGNVRPDINKLRLKASDSGSKTQRVTRFVYIFNVFEDVRWNRAVGFTSNKNIILKRTHIEHINRRIQSNNWDPNPTARPTLSIRVGGIGRSSHYNTSDLIAHK